MVKLPRKGLSSLVHVVDLTSTEHFTRIRDAAVGQTTSSSFPGIVLLFLVSCLVLYLCQHNSVGRGSSVCLRRVAEETGGVRPVTHGVGEV